MFRQLSGLGVRMLAGHVAIAAVSVFALSLMLLLDARKVVQPGVAAWYSDTRAVTERVLKNWITGVPDGEPNGRHGVFTSGFTLITSASGVIRYSQGETPCRAGVALRDCAPGLIGAPDGTQRIAMDGLLWGELVQSLTSGDRVFTRREVVADYEIFVLAQDFALPGRGIHVFALFQGALAGMLALPMAAIAIHWIAGPGARRITHIAAVCRAWADGDLAVRVRDRHSDDIGQLARDLDDMADSLAQQAEALNELLRRNTLLVQQAERSAQHAERLQLARDLHDSVAQQVFSLSMLAASLPDALRNSRQGGLEKATVIASAAERAMLDLRAVLTDARPASVIEHGLAEALERLCREWQAAHRVVLEHSLLLSGRPIPADVEMIVYRISQEALNNIAKHAQAASVQVLLVQGKQHIALSISDDGCGIRPEVIAAGKLGLAGMRERAQMSGGELVIERGPGGGTTVQLTLPLTKDEIRDDNPGDDR